MRWQDDEAKRRLARRRKGTVADGRRVHSHVVGHVNRIQLQQQFFVNFAFLKQLQSLHLVVKILVRASVWFEHFLKHLVGGLHTVYTKLKRLEITPVVCNVEQVKPDIERKILIVCLLGACVSAREGNRSAFA